MGLFMLEDLSSLSKFKDQLLKNTDFFAKMVLYVNEGLFLQQERHRGGQSKIQLMQLGFVW